MEWAEAELSCQLTPATNTTQQFTPQKWVATPWASFEPQLGLVDSKTDTSSNVHVQHAHPKVPFSFPVLQPSAQPATHPAPFPMRFPLKVSIWSLQKSGSFQEEEQLVRLQRASSSPSADTVLTPSRTWSAANHSAQSRLQSCMWKCSPSFVLSVHQPAACNSPLLPPSFSLSFYLHALLSFHPRLSEILQVAALCHLKLPVQFVAPPPKLSSLGFAFRDLETSPFPSFSVFVRFPPSTCYYSCHSGAKVNQQRAENARDRKPIESRSRWQTL